MDKQIYSNLKVYTDSHSGALDWLVDNARRLPKLEPVVGDFNVHSVQCESDAASESLRAHSWWGRRLGGAQPGECGRRGNAPSEQPRASQHGPRPIWVSTDVLEAENGCAVVDMEGRGFSDHAMI